MQDLAENVMLIISDIPLSSSAKSDILTVLKYKFHIINVIAGKAAKRLKMQDIPVECFVKLSQVWYSYCIII